MRPAGLKIAPADRPSDYLIIRERGLITHDDGTKSCSNGSYHCCKTQEIQCFIKDFFGSNNDAKEADLPIFVTVDALLHAYHELFDYALRTLETQEFTEDLNDLTLALLAASQLQYEEATDNQVKEAVRKNIAYLAVAEKLLDPATLIPTELLDLVNEELAQIETHTDIVASPTFDYQEDYSQYAPRGHYTLS